MTINKGGFRLESIADEPTKTKLKRDTDTFSKQKRT